MQWISDRNAQFTVQICKGMGFGFLGGFRVNLHRGADVLVSHDVLNDLQVG